MDEQEFDVVVRLEDPELAAELESWLREEGADDIDVVREQGIMDLFFVTIMVLVTVQYIVSIGFWMRDRTRSRTIYDFRRETVQVYQDSTNHDGRMIVIGPDGRSHVCDPIRPADLNQLLIAVLGNGGE